MINAFKNKETFEYVVPKAKTSTSILSKNRGSVYGRMVLAAETVNSVIAESGTQDKVSPGTTTRGASCFDLSLLACRCPRLLP